MKKKTKIISPSATVLGVKHFYYSVSVTKLLIIKTHKAKDTEEEKKKG